MIAFSSGRKPGVPSLACLLALIVCAARTPLAAQEWFPASDWENLSQEPVGPADISSVAQPAYGQSPALRPGFLEGLGNLARGRTQLEGGYVYLSDEGDGIRTAQHAVPDLLLRFGLTDRLEIRLGWPGYVATEYDGRLASHSSHDEMLEPNVGFMLDLWPQGGIVPQTAVLAAVPVTLKGNPFALHGLQPLTQLLYRWQLTDRLALGGTTGVALFDVDGDEFIQLQQTCSLDSILTDHLSAFGEWEMLVDHASTDDGSQHMLGGGFSYLLTERLQATWRAALGVNPRAPDFLTGVRFSFRF